ncbi:MAG: hypothetical protein E2O39_00385 [Planctomycetota bacterium]|nr:MAG: hypothetical protein E2O39_00385 [Planctomycetota bacterium]
MIRREQEPAWPRVAFACYLGVCACALVWPGYALAGDRIEPFVLGLPFAFAWTIGWVLAAFLGLLVFHGLAGPKDRG